MVKIFREDQIRAAHPNRQLSTEEVLQESVKIANQAMGYAKGEKLMRWKCIGIFSLAVVMGSFVLVNDEIFSTFRLFLVTVNGASVCVGLFQIAKHLSAIIRLNSLITKTINTLDEYQDNIRILNKNQNQQSSIN